LKQFETAEKNEIKDNKWCILTIFKTIWKCREKKKMKTLNGTF